MDELKDLAEVEPIVAQWIRERGTMMDGASYAAALELAAYVAARRTTPDREAIIEECAKVCEAWSASIDTGPRRNRVVAAAMQGALTCAFEIRALKTAPTSDKGGA
ncbi:hypothetical protein [Burkholderia cenocepacia]|uniref:hypothetical protein n=1 Tax=Burkholderia cenocepacia TaxID=95486 RepID=UPI002B2514BC|nr:hypothetical protein [Burkholderia cenocepacia]MEB2544322.1 hypothetical protein [Burkholderia cenocepacia]